MRNYILLLTVLSVVIWTGKGDIAQGLGTKRQDDFYLDLDDEDMTDVEGSGEIGSGYSSYYSDGSYSSSFSSLTAADSESYSSDITISLEPVANPVTVIGQMSLEQEYIPSLGDRSSPEYQLLENSFIAKVDGTMRNSPLAVHYVECEVHGFTPGSIVVDFGIVLKGMDVTDENVDMPLEEFSVKEVMIGGLNAGKFAELNANASSLVINMRDMDTTTPPMKPDTMSTTENNKIPIKKSGKTTEMSNVIGPYNPDPKNRDAAKNPSKESKDSGILYMILSDPILIAAIAGGLIVIVLSVVLLFLFVVYRLKKKDEGSYSLDEPNKAKDPTAYWKETKEFYA